MHDPHPERYAPRPPARGATRAYLPVRQWVLSVPRRLRPFLHQTPEVASAVLGIFLRALRSTLRDASPGALQASQLGAIPFPQRFGSSLNPHYHYHVLVLDGLISNDLDHGVWFHEATALEAPLEQPLGRADFRSTARFGSRPVIGLGWSGSFGIVRGDPWPWSGCSSPAASGRSPPRRPTWAAR